MSELQSSEKNSVAVVTGGAGGMGLATAKILGLKHHVLIVDMNLERLEAAASELRELGVRCDVAVCDISNRAAVDNLAQQASKLGRVAAVVHSAGISPQMAPAEQILRVNALGTVNIAEVFLAIAEEGFALVNVASNSAYMLPNIILPTRAYAYAAESPEVFMKKILFRVNLVPKEFYRKGMAYSISKNFVKWYSAASAGKFGEKNCRILSVSPGTFDTAMGRLEEKSGSMEMLKTAALKRAGRPEEIAEVLAFCASDKASYLTGVDVLCDGGVIAGRAAR